jgi:hypothetical protein
MGIRLILIVVATGFAVGPAGGYLGQVVQSFPSPGINPNALARGPGYLYVLCDGPPYIYRLDPANGSVISSYPSPFGFPTRGLGYEYGGYLWIGTYSIMNSWIARCQEGTGSIYSSFRVTEHEMLGGVACEGNPNKRGTLRAIISNSFYDEPVTRHTTAGSLLSKFRYLDPLTFFDPAWDYGNALIWWGDRTTYKPHVYGFTRRGSLVASFRAPTGGTHGCTYLDGYLWISTDGQPDYIWKVHCPKDFEGVFPASLGRVKALYR